MAVSKVVYGNQTLIDLTTDTVNTESLLEGVTAHKADGTPVTGECTYDADTSDATALATEILATKSAYVNGSKVDGTMPNNGSISGSISTKDGTYTIPRGYHDGTGEVEIDSSQQSRIVPENIKDGVTILGVEGTYTGEGGTYEQINVTPYTTPQTITPSSGYDAISQVSVAAIAYTETPAAQGGGTVVTIGTVAPV